MIQEFNVALFYWLHSFAGRSVVGDTLIIFAAEYLIYIIAAVVVGLVAASFFHRRLHCKLHCNIRLAVVAILATILARVLLTEFIRIIYANPRPFEVLNDVHQLVRHVGGNSFPSGHASAAFAMAGAILVCYPRFGSIALLAAVAVGVSRVIAGVHWPIDIVGGAILGVSSALIAVYAHDRMHYWLRGKKYYCEFCQSSLKQNK